MLSSAAQHNVTVIVPTACRRARALLLDRAIASVHAQTGPSVEILVVVNGQQADEALLDALRHDTRITTFVLAEANVSAARHLGVTKASGSFYCFIDDDDELLDGSIAKRVELLERNPDADFVITNGLIHTDHDAPLVLPGHGRAINADPCGALLSANYFANPSTMFRASSVEAAYFDIRREYFEWTYLLFRLVTSGKRMRYDDCITYRKYENHQDSVSKTDAYALAYASSLMELRALPVTAHVQKLLIRRSHDALHATSELHLARGRLRAAWAAHSKCLAEGGWRYLSFTRHLLAASARRLPMPP